MNQPQLEPSSPRSCTPPFPPFHNVWLPLSLSPPPSRFRCPLSLSHTHQRFAAVHRYLASVGNLADSHVAHFHAHTGVSYGHRTDVLSLLPAAQREFDMFADNVGTWNSHCHVTSHNSAGMNTKYVVSATPPDYPTNPPTNGPTTTSTTTTTTTTTTTSTTTTTTAEPEGVVGETALGSAGLPIVLGVAAAALVACCIVAAVAYKSGKSASSGSGGGSIRSSMGGGVNLDSMNDGMDSTLCGSV